MKKPLISIITATYNRSKILYYSILSVLFQSYDNWELIVVGDHCTDNTEDIVHSFNDSRISYENLPQNFGEQSLPNSIGMKKAKGDFIAFLNHDDIWLPDHLESSLSRLNSCEADMVYSLMGLYGNFNEKSVICNTPEGVYRPGIVVPASAWLLKNVIPHKIGYWRPAKEMIVFPSEDYIYRIWKAGFKIVSNPQMTVIKTTSIAKINSYMNEDSLNKEIYEGIVSDNNFRESFLTDIIIGSFADYSIKIHLFKLIREITRVVSTFIAKIFGIHPSIIINFIAFRGGKGKGINFLRTRRGLKKI